MKLILLVPKVVQNYINQFPEVRHNAYKYFNYDNTVVDERVNRHDAKLPYKDADDFSASDYQSLLTSAKTIINPILAKYSSDVAYEDALHMAIRSYNNGLFDGKVNAGRFSVLKKALATPIVPMAPCPCGVMAKKEKEKEKKVLKPIQVKQLGLTPKGTPVRQQ